MKYKLIIWSFFICINAFGNAHIRVDVSNFKEIEAVSVYVPVNEYVNGSQQTWYYPVNYLVNIELNITSTVFVKLDGLGRKYYVIISPGDNIELKVSSKGDIQKSFSFKGSNAAGQYWYNVYNYSPLDNFRGLRPIISSLADDNNNTIFNNTVNFLNKELRPLDALYKQMQINSQFLTIAKADLRAMYVGFLLTQVRTLRERKPEMNLDNKYYELIDKFSNALGTNNVLFTKTYFGRMFLDDYWASRINYTKGFFKHNAYEMGPYNGYQLAEGAIRCFLIGDQLFFQKVFGTNEFDFDKTFATYRAEFPGSAYINLLDKLQKNSQIIYANSPSPNIVIDTTSKFNTLADIKQYFKGKNIYIDMWATWCMPCRMEFPYYTKIKKLLTDKKVTPVFISIDVPQSRFLWQSLIKQNQLYGYHILANTNLKKSIQKIVYKNGQVSVPRYILISDKGAILSWDAPRPSDPALNKALNTLNDYH